MTEIEQLRERNREKEIEVLHAKVVELEERNKELERLAEYGWVLRQEFAEPREYGLMRRSELLDFDALYAKLFSPEAKFKQGQYVKTSDSESAVAYPIRKRKVKGSQWIYSFCEIEGPWYPESELSALSEEEAGRG